MENEQKKQPADAGEGRNEKGQWVKGVSGNPEGAKKGQGISLVGLLKKKLETIPDGVDKLSFAEAIIEVLVKKAIKDEDIHAIKDIINRVDGMPRESIDVTGEGVPIALIEFVGKGDKVAENVEVTEIDDES